MPAQAKHQGLALIKHCLEGGPVGHFMNFQPDPELCKVSLISFQLLERGFLLGVVPEVDHWETLTLWVSGLSQELLCLMLIVIVAHEIRIVAWHTRGQDAVSDNTIAFTNVLDNRLLVDGVIERLTYFGVREGFLVQVKSDVEQMQGRFPHIGVGT